MRRSILFIKPLTPINFVNRDDASKTDLQLHESLAFMQLLSQFADVRAATTYDIQHTHDIYKGVQYSAIELRTFIATSMQEFEAMHDFVIDYMRLYTEFDTLVILNAPTNTDTIKTESELAQLLSYYLVVNSFPGKIVYMLNDLRLPMYRSLSDCALLQEFDSVINRFEHCTINRDVTLITQAENLTLEYFDNAQLVKPIAIHYVPLQYIACVNRQNNSNLGNPRKYDVGYSMMHVYTMDNTRFSKLCEYMNAKHTYNATCIGAIDPTDSQLAYMQFADVKLRTLGIIKYNDLHNVLLEFKTMLILNEALYTQYKLMPNRVYEALYAGCIPFFDWETFKEYDDIPSELFVSSAQHLQDKLESLKHPRIAASYYELAARLVVPQYRAVSELTSKLQQVIDIPC